MRPHVDILLIVEKDLKVEFKVEPYLVYTELTS